MQTNLTFWKLANPSDEHAPNEACTSISALTHIMQFFIACFFFALDPFLSCNFCLEFVTKNTACVNGTIEITLEQIQCDIVTNLQCQNCCKFVLCVSRHLTTPCFGTNFDTDVKTHAKTPMTTHIS